ncbi:hypothetical protein H6P81_012271 [Aristolochia fimbriata]|uniref:Uncharacterized protein n=1 Tax=Aristolochia fimbriata TaxID=158543 RepID=A0AAV7EBN4_ARIFI|nr:hypothetical protein H6P81_012271 [Aristolochia fimbriata]
MSSMLLVSLERPKPEDRALYHRGLHRRGREALEESRCYGQPSTHPRTCSQRLYMRWYLGATRRFIAPPPTEPAMLGCVRNVVERVNHRAALYPSSTHPHWRRLDKIVGRSCTPSTLGGSATSGGDVSHALVSLLTWSSQPETSSTTASCKASAYSSRRRLRVEDSTRFHRTAGLTVLDLPPESRHPDMEPSQPFEQPLGGRRSQSEPGRHPPIRRIYTRKRKRQLVHRA